MTYSKGKPRTTDDLWEDVFPTGAKATQDKQAVQPLKLDRDAAKRFLDALVGRDSSYESFCFQTADDNKARKHLAHVYTLPLANAATTLEDLNRQGAAVWVTINRTGGKGRLAKNVTAVSAVFVDLDGAPIQPVQAWALKPYIVVETSPGKYHVYYRTDGSVTLEAFTTIQLKLATLFDGDPRVSDLPRVMRLPGAWHMKGEPFRSRIVNIDESAPRYSLADFEQALADVEIPDGGHGKPKSERKPREALRAAQWLNQEALHRIGDWAPQFFPGGRWSGGAWRVAHEALGRLCEEDLAIHPDGVRDFGQENMPGDERPRVTYTPIRLLAAFFNMGDGELELAEFDECCRPQGTATHEQAATALAVALGMDWAALLKEDENNAEWFEAQADAGSKKPGGVLQTALASTFEPRGVEWFWPDRFGLGHLSLIAGLPDKGKGLITTFMIAAATTGGEWPCGEGKAIRGSVILFTAEDGINDTVVPRLKAAGADLDKVHIVGMKRNADGTERMFNLASDLALLEETIARIGDVVLIIVDPVSSYLGVGKIDSFRTTDVRGVLAPLATLVERHHVCFVGVMHFNKKADVSNAMLRIADSLAYVAAARHVYVCIDDGETPGQRLFVKAKNNLAPDKAALTYTVSVKCIGHDKHLNKDIWAPYVIFGNEHREITATEAMQQADGAGAPRNAAHLEAETFLKERLANGPVPQDDILDEAKGHGIAAKTLQRAKRKLNVVSAKEKGTMYGKWRWALLPDEQDGHV